MTDLATSALRSNLRIYALPALLAVASGAGLIGALLTDGPLDAIAALGVALPLIVAAWHLRRSWSAKRNKADDVAIS